MKMHPGASELLAHTPRPGESQIEVLTRNLAAAKQELKQYETKLFACERSILALKKENAELTALVAKARELGFAPADEEARGPGPGTGPRAAGRPRPARLAERPHGAAGAAGGPQGPRA